MTHLNKETTHLDFVMFEASETKSLNELEEKEETADNKTQVIDVFMDENSFGAGITLPDDFSLPEKSVKTNKK